MCGKDRIREIKLGRLDLSDYLVHFIKQDNKNLFEILKNIVADGQIKCGWAR